MCDHLVPEDQARADADYFVMSSSKNKGKLHLPAPGSTQTEPIPICQTEFRSYTEVTWIAKDVAVIPAGFWPICETCRHVLAENGHQDAIELGDET